VAATELLEKGISHFPDRLVMTEKLADLYYQQAQDYYLRASQHPTFSKKYLNLCWDFLTKSLYYHRHHPQALELRKLLMSHKKTGKRRR